MPFPTLNTLNLTNPTYSAGLSMPAQAGLAGTAWNIATRSIQTKPTTSALQIFWAANWSVGAEIDLYSAILYAGSTPTASAPGGAIVPGAGYSLGSNTVDLGAVTASDGSNNARRLRATVTPGNNFLIHTSVHAVVPNSAYSLLINIRRNAGTLAVGELLSFNEYAGFSGAEDSSQFDEGLVDPAIKKELEGGFVITRRRFTRTMRTFTTGFTNISNADKVAFMNFVASVGGTSGSFAYSHPVSGELFTVRFKEMPTPKYAGMGGNHRWDIKPIKLETV